MYLNVCMQIRHAIKRFAAFIARVWLNRSVSQLVSSQIAWLSKSSTAYVTFEGFFSSMNSLQTLKKIDKNSILFVQLTAFDSDCIIL